MPASRCTTLARRCVNAGYLALSAAQFNAACAAATRSACGIQADAKQLLSTCSVVFALSLMRCS